MSNPDQQNIEDWNVFEKRVYDSERNYSTLYQPVVKAASVVAIVIGFVLVGIHRFVFSNLLIHNAGMILFSLAAFGFFGIYFLKTSAASMKKERDRMIHSRGNVAPCKHLQGNLPDGLSPQSGRCSLYDKSLQSSPYCIYCKSYITAKMQDEMKLKAHIKEKKNPYNVD